MKYCCKKIEEMIKEYAVDEDYNEEKQCMEHFIEAVTYVMHDNYESKVLKLNYCPFCGTKLNKEK